MIHITELHGRFWYSVDDADRGRAIDAAEAVCRDAGISPAAAFSAYRQQWEEFDDEAPMHGAARVWCDAISAANAALTDTWADADGDAWCEIAV